MPRRIALAVSLLVTLAAAAATAPAASAREFAPLDRPGPAIDAHAKLTCTADVAGAKVEPVLLNPATGVTVQQNYAWNYERAFTALDIPYCAYDAPQHTLGDIQTSGELLVDAIRRMHALAGRRIAIVGHSQGGMSFRWALRFWPDTRAMVDDTIGFAGSNHGTTLVGACSLGCPPAVWQQADEARFMRALNSRAETFAGISYTNVYTHTDAVVLPNSGPGRSSSSLTTGAGRITNVAVQDICPADVYGHLLIGTVDPVAYALAIDALTHDGPADPARIDRAVCLQKAQPGVDPASADGIIAALSAPTRPGSANAGDVPSVKAEPPLRCYVWADCADLQQTEPGARTCASRRRFTVHVPRGVRHVRVTLAGRRLTVRHRRVVVDLRGRGHGTVKLRITGRRSGSRFVQIHRYHPCVRR